MLSSTVFINVTSQDPKWVGSVTEMLPVRAGPLLGHTSGYVTIHCYVDGSFVTAIFNNQTALTAVAMPSSDSAAEVSMFGLSAGANVNVWKLKGASHTYQNNGAQVTSSGSPGASNSDVFV